MARRKNFTDEEISKIFHLKSNGFTWKNIGIALEAAPSTVRKAYYNTRKRAGLPPKEKLSKSTVSGRLALIAKKIVFENPKIPYRDIPGKIIETIGPVENMPSYKDFERFLVKSNFKIVKLLKKPLISELNIAKRIKFAKEYSEKSQDFWNYVIWSDETMVRSFSNSNDVFVKTNSSVCRKNLPVNSQVQNGGVSVMFWGCFSRLGLGPLAAIQESMNAESYKEILNELLLPELRAAGVPMVFMQDNAPCHKARLVLDFLEENGVQTLPWPPQSPDMNPIENLWAIIKARRKKKFGPPKTKNELIDQVFTIWNDIDSELCEKLSDSMIKRLDKVLEFNGKPINY